MTVTGFSGLANRFRTELFRFTRHERAARKGRRDRERVTDEAEPRCLCFEASGFSAAADEPVGRAQLMVPDLARATEVPAHEFACRNDAAADPRAQR